MGALFVSHRGGSWYLNYMNKKHTYHAPHQPLDSLLPIDTAPEIRKLYEEIPELVKTLSFGIEDEVVLLDLETTGLHESTDRITEIALMKMRGPEIVERWSTLINPGQSIPSYIENITGISDEMVADAPTFDEIADEVRQFIGSCDLIAHNAHFDRGFLKRAFGTPLKNRWMDTIYLAQIGLPRLLRYSQPTLASWLNPEAGANAHRAVADVEVLSCVWRASLCGMYGLDYLTLQAIADLPCMGCGAEHIWMKQVLGARSDESDKAFSLRALRHRWVKSDQADPLNDADHIRMNFSYEGDVMDVVNPSPDSVSPSEKMGVPRMYEDFELRPAQTEMANAIYWAFLQSHFLAIEAGTGVGKSLAYLLPAALVALENQVPIGIATRSNNLTDQLLTREIPRLNELFGGKLRYTAVKGYDNYVCLRKIDALLHNNENARNLGHILAWISQSAWGDIGRISMASRNDKTYIATQQECTNKKCRFYPNLCYLHGTRKRAQSSHLVVTNHSLLFRDAMSPKRILPPIRYWIVDEAHGIEKEARDQLSFIFDFYRTSQLLKNFTNRHGGLSQRLDGLLRKSAGNEGEKSSIAQTLVSLAGFLEQAQTIFESLRADADAVISQFNQQSSGRELWISQEIRMSTQWAALAATGRSLYGKLEKAVGKGRTLSNEMSLIEDIKDDDLAIEASGYFYDIASIITALGVVIDEPEDNLVYSIEKMGNRGVTRLVAAPLEVGPIIENEIYGSVRSLVYTSATMTVADKFKYFAQSVGLDLVEPSRVEEKQLKSSYRLHEQMRIFVVSDLPDPREARYQSHLAQFSEELHLALGGGVLSLYTNRRDMESVYESMNRNLSHNDLKVLLQREGASNMALAKEFIENKDVSLMALRSFWEGFDAKGDTLKCVFIPKLPFAMPGTPLALERNLREGAKAWNRYDLPEAIIDLRQAIGRLIRSSQDSGFVVLGDSRLINKAYGKRVLKSLPVDAEILTSAEIIQILSEKR